MHAALLERRRVHQSRCAVNGVRRARSCTERRDDRAAIRKLVLDPAHPTRHDLDVLEGIAANGLANDPDRLYLRQAEAFDVERLTDRFYRAYADLFHRTVARVQEANRGHEAFATAEGTRAFAQRLLHRLLFLYFLQRKGWLADDPRFLTTWYRRVTRADPPGNAWRDLLRPLFFDTLNRRRMGDGSPRRTIPYLNGRLFEPEGRTPTGGSSCPTTCSTPATRRESWASWTATTLPSPRRRRRSKRWRSTRPIVHFLARRALLHRCQVERVPWAEVIETHHLIHRLQIGGGHIYQRQVGERS